MAIFPAGRKFGRMIWPSSSKTSLGFFGEVAVQLTRQFPVDDLEGEGAFSLEEAVDPFRICSSGNLDKDLIRSLLSDIGL